jgi:aldehyde:ferredoxin oxidoreductase
MTRELLEELTVGTRTVAGTDWPIVDQLWRTGPRSWEIVRELCNGVPRTSEEYRSESAAREAFGSRLEGRKPRAGAAASVRIALRITPTESDTWKAAAEREGLPVGEWIRRLCASASI